MTISQSKKIVQDNQYLKGSFYKDDEISDLIIVPKSDQGFSNVIACIINDKNYDHLLAVQYDFEVIVLLNFDDYPLTGVLKWEYLYNILQNHQH